MSIDCTSVPRHLKVMRAITGIEETPGDADNPKIMGMRDWVACTYPEMMSYCEEYTHDSVAWCGLTMAFCVTVAGIRPPFGPTDTDKFLWALAWADDEGFDHLSEPVLGTIVVMEREGGGHITAFEGWVDSSHQEFYARGGNQSDAVNVQVYDRDVVVAWCWPVGVPKPAPGPTPEPPDGDHPELEKGDVGPPVGQVQTILGIIPADGEFGSITEGGVKGFQRACGLSADGVVGDMTWGELDDLDARKKAGSDGLTSAQVTAIVALAESSAIAGYDWRDRGRAPKGWTSGLALSFALAVTLLEDGDPGVRRMARAEENDNEDCLHWYASEYRSLKLDNSEDGVDTLRHLFALILGLGMRESSGRYCEGRDMSASNVSADTAEAGCLQTSWNIRSCDPYIEPLLDEYYDNPNGFLSTFQRGVSPDSNDLDNYGSGQDGTKYQFLSKYAPAFHVFVTAIGMRSLGGEEGHWGPLRRHEAELKQAADDLLYQVQQLVLSE